MNVHVEIFTKSTCPYCVRAKKLLEEKEIAFHEISLEQHPERRAEMEKRSGRHTVPQIFIGDVHVGGCDDLYALEEAGKLDELLDQ
jgi:glutaredoxin 3